MNNDNKKELDILNGLKEAYKKINDLKNTISHKKISLEISRKIHNERKKTETKGNLQSDIK